MSSSYNPNDWLVFVAAAADLCLKPWKHSVVYQNWNANEPIQEDQAIELVLRVECRSQEGVRHSENDLELEIYRSGDELNLILGWCNQLDRPILWQGQHSVWMDANNGKRCQAPSSGANLEALARRLRALFEIQKES